MLTLQLSSMFSCFFTHNTSRLATKMLNSRSVFWDLLQIPRNHILNHSTWIKKPKLFVYSQLLHFPRNFHPKYVFVLKLRVLRGVISPSSALESLHRLHIDSMLACLQGKINRILFNCFPHLSGESHASQIFRASRVSSEAKKSRGETDKNTSWKFIHFQILCSSLLLHWIFSIAAHLAFDEHRNQRWFFASHIHKCEQNVVSLRKMKQTLTWW